jgi:hypothetical protein
MMQRVLRIVTVEGLDLVLSLSQDGSRAVAAWFDGAHGSTGLTMRAYWGVRA